MNTATGLATLVCGPSAQLTKNFKTMTAEHRTEFGDPVSSGLCAAAPS